MNLAAFDLPEETQALSEWLVSQLTGDNLSSVVTQLSAVHADQDQDLTLETVCGDQWENILQNGFSELTQTQLQQLLTHPYLLLELQELLLLEGSDFWQKHFLSQNNDSEITDNKLALQEQLFSPPPEPETVQQPVDYKKSSYRKIAVLGFVSAALICVAVFLNQQPSAPAGWGWNRPGALTADIPANQYLNRLADSANEWFKKPTETKASLITRLTQFRAGCETLINAPHPQLSPEDRVWLIERCQAWADKLDEQIVALQKGTTDLKTADASADALINKLVKALRNRAEQIG
ncbi:hypothetical protein [Gimesia maris]|uniref:hypothetical protein n=1 Tax=Gimesia maris TaxID=122 RepID=UPI00241BF2EE|nr:hypothetical protein [Gimesia maris]|tara:strand:- start:13917 stop:14795 length:879 start_codon:yes stop_codon:yes gene_type:complete